MSDDTTLPPSSAPGPEPSGLKSLLNPIQSGAATPSSTIVEAPRSPQLAAPVPQIPIESSEANGVKTLEDKVAPAPTVEEPAVISQNGNDHSLPPLPVDAPVPPSPRAADEPPPVPAPGAIPPAVSTPTVLTEEAIPEPGPVEGTPQPPAPPVSELPPPPAESMPPTPSVETAPAVPTEAPPAPVEAQPTAPVAQPPTPAAVNPTLAASSAAPSGFVEPLPTPVNGTPAPTTAAAPVAADEPMDVDRPESSPQNSLKRTGGELDEGREEKRIKDDAAPVSQAPAPVVQAIPETSAPAPGAAAAAAPPPPAATAGAVAPGVPAGGLVPIDIPPPPVASGPTTPLTLTQHKHLLGVIRSLKKNKDAISFLAPVDPVLFGIPHYPQFITNPMDLGTVETKLIVSDPRGPPKDKSKMNKWDESKGRYNSVADFSRDVRQIWWNTARFNGTEHLVTQAAYRLDSAFTKALNNMPAEAPATPLAPPPVTPSSAAGPSTHARRQSVSQVPLPRRTSDSTDRPKREIHPPPSKDLSYADAPARKPKRRNDPQLQWALKMLKSFETTNKTYDIVSPFLYPVGELVANLPDYASIIKKPIDLLMIKEKLDTGSYDDISQVTDDIKLMVSNALKYNNPADQVSVSAEQLGQLWDEKLKSLPPKQEVRESSEDPLGASMYGDGDSDDEEDESKIAEYTTQIADLQSKIESLRAKQAARKANKQKRPKKSGSSKPRKQSLAKTSPGLANGSGKKARKPKDISYRDDEDDEEIILTTTQKTDLANKIQNADGITLSKAVSIIQTAQDVAEDGEIELDIDSLPNAVIKELYLLVVGPIKKARKSAYVPTGKKPGRKPGGPRKSMNEAEEAERIARMQAQLQSFEGRAQPANGFAEDDSESSEEEDSDLE